MFRFLVLLCVFLPVFVMAETDDEIADILIQQSIASYPSNCACPYNSMRNGRSCGGRSAYSRRGGYAPLCYRNDVSLEEIQIWRKAHGQVKLEKPKPVPAKLPSPQATLSTGAFSALYKREDWPHWSDLDHDCQNTRQEVLIRDSKVAVKFRGNKKCEVESGQWFGVYTGKTFTNPGDIDIDHVISLKWANGHGGSQWSKVQKQAFANDMENLLPVDASANRSKGDKGPDEWMPSRQAYRCEYLGKFRTLVIRYKLQYAPAEKRTIDRMAEACRK